MRKVVILCLGLWWEWLYSQESSSDGVSVGLSEARDSSRDGMIVSSSRWRSSFVVGVGDLVLVYFVAFVGA
ncbi:hypothetical protein QJS10_CPA08g00731 [Acorus calamus]|uniref:Uncharacterized protein n=1 Tax=Acorus calamus TaxID=4465 RepID=A0AAV9EAB5_ACOCL|nr:hypothetical protein QJS10_CPA08g00731 [Acorus calamus]